MAYQESILIITRKLNFGCTPALICHVNLLIEGLLLVVMYDFMHKPVWYDNYAAI